MAKHRKALHRKAHPKNRSLSARLSAAAIAGLRAAAAQADVSVNEYLEVLGLSNTPPTDTVPLEES
jgi:hypothetical protein